MDTPYVCAVCGRAIMVGRHSSGWRHAAEEHADHRVVPVKRVEYESKPAHPSAGSSSDLPTES